MFAKGVGKKKDGIFASIDDTTPDPIAKIDCCLDVQEKISSLVATQKQMKAVAIDVKKMAGEAKQLRWENAKLMMERLWHYMPEIEESADAVFKSS